MTKIKPKANRIIKLQLNSHESTHLFDDDDDEKGKINNDPFVELVRKKKKNKENKRLFVRILFLIYFVLLLSRSTVNGVLK